MRSALKSPEMNVRVRRQALFFFPAPSGKLPIFYFRIPSHLCKHMQLWATCCFLANIPCNQSLFNSAETGQRTENFWVKRASHLPERLSSTSSTIAHTSSDVFCRACLKNCRKHFISSTSSFGTKHNKHFLPLSSARVRRAKTTEEIFIFHSCSLHKLPVKCL